MPELTEEQKKEEAKKIERMKKLYASMPTQLHKMAFTNYLDMMRDRLDMLAGEYPEEYEKIKPEVNSNKANSRHLLPTIVSGCRKLLRQTCNIIMPHYICADGIKDRAISLFIGSPAYDPVGSMRILVSYRDIHASWSFKSKFHDFVRIKYRKGRCFDEIRKSFSAFLN